ncbi:MAG: chemotaxis protein MotA [Salinicola sp.]|uniref:motility protein A n=1 Tax=uncultured Salinicola sp. TaxID=1193542 RepID=UPI000C969DFD|nr:MotA/TolQ/ExbB proton channel family protein [uncultured Salinicola sp.]MAM57729.1 chemotaxis protein MotA [Salinicola sp.]|tara:strand:- start:149 stop:967 length:819 start_codon:yes stop_codon:yes gene_type:complete
MNPSTLIGIIASALLLATVVLFTAQAPSSFFNLPGLAIVLTGTLAASFISYPLREMQRLCRQIAVVFRREPQASELESDLEQLIEMSRHWSRGNIRAIEGALESTTNPFLRTGIQMVIANTREEEIREMLRWRMVRVKAKERTEAQILRTMAVYAPAFGMLGTLVGLINMLEVIQAGDLAVIGPRLAVALMSTFYGILLANLLFKPVAVKLERRTEARLMAMTLLLEGIMMVSKRRLPAFIEEALNTYRAEHRDEMRDVRRPQPADAAAESA